MIFIDKLFFWYESIFVEGSFEIQSMKKISALVYVPVLLLPKVDQLFTKNGISPEPAYQIAWDLKFKLFVLFPSIFINTKKHGS